MTTPGRWVGHNDIGNIIAIDVADGDGKTKKPARQPSAVYLVPIAAIERIERQRIGEAGFRAEDDIDLVDSPHPDHQVGDAVAVDIANGDSPAAIGITSVCHCPIDAEAERADTGGGGGILVVIGHHLPTILKAHQIVELVGRGGGVSRGVHLDIGLTGGSSGGAVEAIGGFRRSGIAVAVGQLAGVGRTGVIAMPVLR